jgi:hypothetical protein
VQGTHGAIRIPPARRQGGKFCNFFADDCGHWGSQKKARRLRRLGPEAPNPHFIAPTLTNGGQGGGHGLDTAVRDRYSTPLP